MDYDHRIDWDQYMISIHNKLYMRIQDSLTNEMIAKDSSLNDSPQIMDCEATVINDSLLRTRRSIDDIKELSQRLEENIAADNGDFKLDVTELISTDIVDYEKVKGGNRVMEKYYLLCLSCLLQEQTRDFIEDDIQDVADCIVLDYAFTLGDKLFGKSFIKRLEDVYEKLKLSMKNIIIGMYIQYIAYADDKKDTYEWYQQYIAKKIFELGIEEKELVASSISSLKNGMNSEELLKSMKIGNERIGNKVGRLGGSFNQGVVLDGSDKECDEFLSGVLAEAMFNDNVNILDYLEGVTNFNINGFCYSAFMSILGLNKIENIVLLLKKGFVSENNINVVIDMCVAYGYTCYIPFLISYK